MVALARGPIGSIPIWRLLHVLLIRFIFIYLFFLSFILFIVEILTGRYGR